MKIHVHDGGERPVSAGAEVVLQFRSRALSGASTRDGTASAPVRAGDYRWKAWPHGESAWDIVRWRFASPEAEAAEEARFNLTVPEAIAA